MKIEIEIKDKDIVNILYSVLENESNDWYRIKELPKDLNFKFATTKDIIRSILCNPKCKIEIIDAKTDEVLGYLCRDNIKLGIESFIENGYIFNSKIDTTMLIFYFNIL